MSKLYLKGIKNPITITTSQAKNLSKWYESDSVADNTKSEIAGVRFIKEDIKYIIENDIDDAKAEVSDSRKIENDNFYSEANKEYNNNIKNLCKRSPQEKAQDTKLYELAWAGFTLKPVTQEFLEEVKKRQTEFFVKYPHFPYASINILDLIPQEKNIEDSVSEVMPQFISRKLNGIISEAFNSARFMKII